MPFKNLRRFAQREHQRFRAIRRLHATLASLFFGLDHDPAARIDFVEDADENRELRRYILPDQMATKESFFPEKNLLQLPLVVSGAI
jgi:hypothetical protein